METIGQQVNNQIINPNIDGNINGNVNAQFRRFENFGELTKSLVNEWVDIIDIAASENRPAAFALAGGSTPAPVYRELDQALAQRTPSDVRLTATDERWVNDNDPQSNEGLFKKCLPLSYGKQWNLVSLKNAANTPEVAMEAINERLHQQLPGRLVRCFWAWGQMVISLPYSPALLCKLMVWIASPQSIRKPIKRGFRYPCHAYYKPKKSG